MKSSAPRLPFPLWAALFLAILNFALAAQAAPIDLRGYGRVSADIKPGRALFQCESTAKADALLDKLQSDLFWDKSLPVTETKVPAGKSTVSVFSKPGYGAAVIARSSRNVLVLGASDESSAAALAAKEPLLLGPDVTSHAAAPHPFCLDYFDNKAFKDYVPEMKSPHKFGIESHWPFMKSIGACEAFFGPFFHCASPAPGVFNWTVDDYEVRTAEQQHDMIVVGPDGGGEAPYWVRNDFPDNMMKPSDTTALGDWGGAGMAGAHYEAWGTPLDHRRELGLGFLQQAMERYKSSPSLGGWMLFAGSPGVEYNFHGRSSRSWDHSATDQEGWRRWLREQHHWSLADLGSRWYGDPRRFSSWDEVQVPDINEFFGNLGPDCLRLAQGWRWCNAPAVTASNPPAPDAAGWIPLAMPPSQQEAFLPRAGFNFFDITFDASSWNHPQGADVWLVFGMIGTGRDSARVWLNGHEIETPKDAASKSGPFAVSVTGLLNSGSNHLQVSLDATSAATNNGSLAGPVFFTVHEPKRLPYLGPQANSRCADYFEWQDWALTDYHRKMFDVARRIDPDRPFVLSGAGTPGVVNYGIQMAIDYGMGIENTGREAFYAPWLASLSIPAGFYPTSEWADTPRGDKLDRGFGWILFDADASHCDYQNIEDFQLREKQDGWFTKHHRQIQLFGKYLRSQPKVALLLSDESERLGSVEPLSSDIGRGEIEAAHFDEVYVTEEGLAAGLADNYPVLMDTASVYTEPATIAAIRRYVEKGGTFIASYNTGRDTLLAPDSFPLSALTGFKVTDHPTNDNIKFESTLPILKDWEGKQFPGQGEALDWQNADHAKAGVSLIPVDSASVSLARWSDGSVAIGCRQIGKGRIIVLGSTFWRHTQDQEGVWRTLDPLEGQFLGSLFQDCGATRDANATVADVWARKMITKNGLQEWLVAYNSTSNPQDANIWMQTAAQPPDDVVDLDTNTKVSAASDNNGISIKALHFAPYEVKVFAVHRADLAGGLDYWWQDKATHWKRTPTELAAQKLPLTQPKSAIADSVIPINQWRFKADTDNSIASQPTWTSTGFNDSQWSARGAGPWNYFDSTLKDYHGTSLYRFKFNLPAGWKGRQIILGLYDFDRPIVYDTGNFFINGTKVATYKKREWSQTFNYDVTKYVHPGENVLALEAIGGPDLGGLGGVVWFESHPILEPSLDLSGTWQGVMGDWLTRQDVNIPGTFRAKYLTRELNIPASWQGKKIYLDWSSNHQWLSCVVINGQPFCYNAFAHPFGLITRLNLTPYLKPGGKNIIEFWPFHTMTVQGDSADNAEESGMELSSVRIGVAAK